MAGENLGTVFYEVHADVTTVSDAKTAVASSTKSMVNNFKGVDTQVTKMSSSVKSGMNNVSRGAGQAGIQIQQFIGQVQGGQSAILAFSQQSTDLGFVLGFPLAGAIAGIAASLAGILLPALFKANDAADKLEKSIERVSAIATLSVDGVVTFGDAVLELSRYSEEASNQLIKLAIEQNEISKIKAGEALYESLKNVSSLGGYTRQAQELRDIGKAAELSDGQIVALAGTTNKLTGVKLDPLSNAYRDAGKSVLYLQTAVEDFKKTQNEATAKNLLHALDGIKVNGKFATDEARDLASEVFKLTTAFFKGEDLSQKLAKGLGTVQTSANELVSSLQMQVQTLGASDRAIALHMASLRGATQAQFDEINAAYDAIEAHDKNEASVKRLASEEQTLADQRKRNADAYNKQMFDQFIAEEKQAQAERDRKKARGETVTAGVTSLAASPLAKLQAEQKSKYDLIAEYEELETANHQIAVDARAAADREYEANKMAALEQMFVNESEMNALIIGSLDSLQSASTNVFSGLLSQTMTAKEAVSAFSNAIVNELIGSLVSVGLQYVKNAIISQSADKAMLTSQLATKAAAATAHTAAVAATVTELVALGAAGAFASTAAIPIVGLGLAPAASATAAGAIGAIGSAAIAAAPIAGMRLYGGYTAPNSMYKVNENGKAEMFSDGKNDFLMTGSSGGKVTSASDLGGSQPVINITTVNNASGTDVQVQQSTSNGQTDIKFIIDTVAGNIASGGKVRTAITRSTSAKNKVV